MKVAMLADLLVACLDVMKAAMKAAMTAI